MMGQRTALPLYDRRRLEALVMEHRMRVHLEQKKGAKPPPKKPA